MKEESVIEHPMKGPAFVMWDVMTCPLPTEEAQCLGIFSNICSALFSHSPTNEFKGDSCLMAISVDIPPDPILRILNREIMLNYSIPEIHVSKMIYHMRYWTKTYPGPATFLVISGDKALSSTLKKLHSRNYNILVAHPDGHSDLAEVASCVWAFPGILRGEPPYHVRREMLPRIFTIPQPKMPTFVLWDVKSCLLPKDESKCRDMLDNIYSTLYANCSCTHITMMAVGLDDETPTTTVNHLFCDMILVFTDSETHVSEMVHEMGDWVMSNPAPAYFLVISGDAALSTPLKQLNSRKYNILVAHPQVYSTDVVAIASHVWHFKSIVCGEPPYIVCTEAEVVAHRVDQEPSELPPASIVRPKRKKRNYQDEKMVPKAARNLPAQEVNVSRVNV